MENISPIGNDAHDGGGSGNGAQSAGWEAASTVPGSAAGVGSSAHPMTNRGCLTPSEGECQPGVTFHIDYLKLTIFADFSTTMDILRTSLLERAGLYEKEWADKGPAGRWENIWVGPGPVEILVPKMTTRRDYCIVEIKGEGCTSIGMKPIGHFLQYLESTGVYWHGLRVDLAFDHVKFGPEVVAAANAAGNFNSRCLGVEDRDWNENALGQTAYLGGRGCKKSRRLRIYNKRGFNRFEAEFRRTWAQETSLLFSRTNCQEWPTIAMGLVRGMVDYVNRNANERVERCPLLPWWADFVGNVERIKNLQCVDRGAERNEQKILAIGQSEERIRRAARSLWPISEAFGWDYLIERIKHHALPRVTNEDKAFVKELKRFEHSGLAGLPGEPEESEDVPI